MKLHELINKPEGSVAKPINEVHEQLLKNINSIFTESKYIPINTSRYEVYEQLCSAHLIVKKIGEVPIITLELYFPAFSSLGAALDIMKEAILEYSEDASYIFVRREVTLNYSPNLIGGNMNYRLSCRLGRSFLPKEVLDDSFALQPPMKI